MVAIHCFRKQAIEAHVHINIFLLSNSADTAWLHLTVVWQGNVWEMEGVCASFKGPSTSHFAFKTTVVN